MRHFIRHPSDIPMDYRVTRYRPSRRDRLKNISPGGLCFETPEALERGCVIQITIPIREPAFEATGTIVWCRRASGHYEVGVQFADANTEFAVRMVEQICQIHHYQREVLEKEGRSLSGEDAAAEWVAKHAQDFPL
ncbi:MAG TPA: PilZ domain-containing protein [Xanthomonadaceae bacterium]|nr:PilZ domain-containing protein [Xanthomonadaceae bacterium]